MRKLLYIVLILITIIPYNVIAINSKNAILYNYDTDEVLYSKNPNQKVSIASMTKIMTCIVVLERVNNLDEKVKMTSPMFYRLVEENASVAGFRIGEEVTYRDLLYGLMLPSGADAAQGLAILTYGNTDNFVKAMNNKAKEIGLKNTRFANPTGLDNKNNYSTVNDVAALLKYSLKNNEFKKIFTTKRYVTSNKKHTFKATITKVKLDTSLIQGDKTGFTYDAGLCMASISHKDNVNLLLVTANAPYQNRRTTHVEDANYLYNYYYKNYSYRKVLNVNDLITTIKLEDGRTIEYYSGKEAEKYLKNDCVLNKKYEGITEQTYENKIGDKLGKYTVKCNDKIVYEQDVFVTLKINKEKKINYIPYIIVGLLLFFILIGIIILIFKVVKNAFIKRRRNKKISNKNK